MQNNDDCKKEKDDCNRRPDAAEQSSDTAKALEDKRKEALYSDGGGRKTDFGGEEQEPPHATENESKK